MAEQDQMADGEVRARRIQFAILSFAGGMLGLFGLGVLGFSTQLSNAAMTWATSGLSVLAAVLLLVAPSRGSVAIAWIAVLLTVVSSLALGFVAFAWPPTSGAGQGPVMGLWFLACGGLLAAAAFRAPVAAWTARRYV
jgi:hypothetical protein